MFPKNERNDKIAKRIFLKTLDEASYFPKYFDIETVNACNARCVMCTINDWKRREDPIMPMEMFQKFVSEVKHYSDWVETVCLNRDGEPSLDRQLPDRIRMLKEAGIKVVTFSTNAQKLTPDTAQKVIEADLDDIMCSIDGTTKETYEKIRIGLNFESVVGNILSLIELRNKLKPTMTIRLRLIILEQNKHEVEDWLKFWKEKVGPNDKIYATPSHSWGGQLRPEDKGKISRFAEVPCVSLFSTMSMHADGMVGICCIDYNVKYPMGDFKTQRIQEIWQGEACTHVRELHASVKRNELAICRGCDVWDRDVVA